MTFGKPQDTGEDRPTDEPEHTEHDGIVDCDGGRRKSEDVPVTQPVMSPSGAHAAAHVTPMQIAARIRLNQVVMRVCS